MCPRDFATVGAEIPIFSAVDGIETIGLRCMCRKTRSAEAPGRPSVSIAPLMSFQKRHDTARGAGGLLRGFLHASQEEIEPGFRIAFDSDPIQRVVVCGPVSLEIETQRKKRLPNHLLGAKQKRDQEATKSTVPVEEGMDGLEPRERGQP